MTNAKFLRARDTMRGAGYKVFHDDRVTIIDSSRLINKVALDNTEDRDGVVNVYKLSIALEIGRYLLSAGLIEFDDRELASGALHITAKTVVIKPKGFLEATLQTIAESVDFEKPDVPIAKLDH